MVPCGFQMVLCGFPMVLCHGAASRHSPAQLCGLPYGALRLPDCWHLASFPMLAPRNFPMALPSQRLLRCGIHFRAAVSGAAADMLLAKRTKMPILCSGRWEGGIGKRKSGLPANHRARFKNSNTS